MKQKDIIKHLTDKNFNLNEWIRVNGLYDLERDINAYAHLILDVGEGEILDSFLRLTMASVRIRMRDILEESE